MTQAVTPHDPRLDFTCRVCRGQHTAPFSYHSKAPHATAAIRSEERIVFTVDQCIIDDRSFYLRGRIPIPVHGFTEPLIWGCWAEISPKNFVRANELWQVEGRESHPAYPGWLNTEIPIYGDTLNLEVNVQTQPVGRRPHFYVTNPQHAIAIEQRDGISVGRLHRIAELLLHPDL